MRIKEMTEDPLMLIMIITNEVIRVSQQRELISNFFTLIKSPFCDGFISYFSVATTLKSFESCNFRFHYLDRTG